ncbi:hypothetical protein GCM10020254_83550 [Streptomyces goshikiensis]
MQLASRALTSGQRKSHLRRDEDGQIIGGEGKGEGEGEEDGADAAAESALLHFSSPRDAATIAAFLRTRVYRPDSLVWLEGYQALLRWRAENEITGVYAVPYDVEVEVGVTKDFPPSAGGCTSSARRCGLGSWRTGARSSRTRRRPAWWGEPGGAAWEAKVAVLRSYRRATGHLAPRQDAMWGEDDEMAPTGQHMANLRRKGAKNGPGKNEGTATARAAQLAEIDKDWDCPWPLGWQRQYRVLADLVDADGQLPGIAPGVLMDGDDIGRWLQQQKQPATWARLLPEQQEQLTKIGVQPNQAPTPAPAASREAKK